MRKLLFIFSVILFSTNLSVFGQTPLIDKAKNAIRQEFKNTLDDYNSYSPVSYSGIDSLFTDIRNNKGFIKMIGNLIESKNKLPDAETIEDYSFDVSPLIELMNESLKKEDDPTVKLFILERKGLYLDFQIAQKYVEEIIKSFKPEFIGWKLTHKYRAKNQYNATVLYEKEFHFDKDIKTVSTIINAKNE